MPSLNTGNAILSNPIKVDSSYNVGIGGAASGSFKLQVTGTTNLTGALTGTSGTFSGAVEGTIFNSTSNAFRFSGSNALSLVTLAGQNVVKINAAGYWGVQLVGANDQGLLINNTGNVGIGTSSPQLKLDIQTGSLGAYHNTASSGGAQIYLGDMNFAGGAYATSAPGIGAAYNSSQAVAGDLAFYIYASTASSRNEAMRIKGGTGNVGIGTTNATSKLTVSGDATINAGTIAAFSFGVTSNSTFAFGSTNGRRSAIIAHESIGDSGLQFGWDTVDKTGIIAGSANVTGAGIDFYTFNGSSWGNRMRITSGGDIQLNTTGSLYSGSNAISIPNSPTTIFTSSGLGGVWLVTYTVSGNPAQVGYAIVGNSFGSTLTVLASAAGSQTALSVSGLNLQLSQSAGGSINTRINVIKLNNTIG